MVNKFKPISISLSPNVQKDDVVLALRLLFQPWKWKQGAAVKQLEKEFAEYLGVKYAFSFNSGRSAQFAILKAFPPAGGLPKGSNVAIQAFTCNAVANPILWAGLNPVYVDCDNDFNGEVERYKGKSYKAAIVQHTFGLPNLKALNENVIEDCAHALGAEINGKKVGTFGKAAFFSFSRDKVISCVYGGMAVTNSDEIGKKLEALQKEFGEPSIFWIFQQIVHPILLWFIILPLYNFLDLGKIFLVISQWLHVLSKAVSLKEKRGELPDYFPKALPNALATMALNQFHKLDTFNAHRQKIAQFYYQELQNTQFILPKKENNIFLRFVIQHPKAHEILYEAWRTENMLLGNWYMSPVDPIDTKLENMRYQKGQCPNAERLSKITLNLPTHINISTDDAKRIVDFLKKYI